MSSPVSAAHRRMLAPIYLPGLLLGIPAQASLVLLPLFVLDQGGSEAAAAAVLGWRAVGMMAMDIPAGFIAARLGEKRVMLLAALVIGVALLAYACAPGWAWFFPIALLNGAGSSTFLLGRMAYVTDHLSNQERGRVIALIAGSMRLASLLGPLLGGALAHTAGYPVALICGSAMVLSGLLCILLTAEGSAKNAPTPVGWRAMPAFAVEYRQVYMTYGMAAVTFMLLRSARTVLLPLVGVGIGLDTVSIGFVVAVSAAVDVLLFYPAGLAMDRFGRRATAIPSCVLFSAVLLSLAAADSYADLLCAAVAAGVANGLSTGIVMTLGTDLAPAARRGEFLGLWRLLTDAGSALGPMAISFLIAAVSVPAASLGVGILGAGGSYVVYRYVAETLQRSR